MPAVRLQYFLCFAVFGALMPYLSVFFRDECGLSDGQIGVVFSVASLSVVVTPVLLTLLADARFESRALMAAIYVLAGAALLALRFAGPAGGFPVVLVTFALFSLAYSPMPPLQDGLYFNLALRQRDTPAPLPPYHRVRLFGTIGFLAPNLSLYFALDAGQPVSYTVLVTAMVCALGVINTVQLPKVRREEESDGSSVGQASAEVGQASRLSSESATGETPGPPSGPPQDRATPDNLDRISSSDAEALAGEPPVAHVESSVAPGSSTSSSDTQTGETPVPPPPQTGETPVPPSPPPPSAKPARNLLPTRAAFRALLAPQMLVFCVAMWLIQMAVSSYYAFIPRYMTQVTEIDRKWIGLIACVGVAVEIVFMLGFGRLVERLGLRRLMLIGVTCMTVRLALLGFVPTVAIAVGTQVFHGVWVLIVHVVPPVFIDRYASSRYRYSMQGLFAMLVYGGGRIVGNLIGGQAAEVHLTWVFIVGAGLCAAALLLLAIGFREPERGRAKPQAVS